ncbi:uncharacterized protein TRIADDRAFT_54842 [Trichoplax adhaerens]|uniref:Uncharacterized protein n=1 Tax=Trichoplax adhaerens TaxID=10228 RepID=B3RT53_TRIAD|nr:hypothetical protein TRIADDRAFT_54842 [Trichoplax adhaerens]EDV26637.1 hypothetical protein TRIADDRAFT_54842 [Trichoplax adhaerens]|eukprot:XP_002110633.1 hypothetical protein TRIADDRAFT_54842 [Trichoplax adhaerens]
MTTRQVLFISVTRVLVKSTHESCAVDMTISAGVIYQSLLLGNTANHSKDANNTFHQLMTVYQSERSEFLRVIKEQSIDVNKEMSPYGLSIFQWLCTKHDVIAIQYLIRECQGQVTAKTALGDTCLMLACAAYATNLTRKYRTVELLIMEGCDVNAKNWTNVTALNIATRMKDGKLWKILFKNG